MAKLASAHEHFYAGTKLGIAIRKQRGVTFSNEFMQQLTWLGLFVGFQIINHPKCNGITYTIYECECHRELLDENMLPLSLVCQQRFVSNVQRTRKRGIRGESWKRRGKERAGKAKWSKSRLDSAAQCLMMWLMQQYILPYSVHIEF